MLNKHCKIDYKEFNRVFYQAVEESSKKNVDLLVEHFYIMCTRYVQEYKHAKLNDTLKEDLLQILVVNCWKSFEKKTFTAGKVTPYWYFYGIISRSVNFFLYREPENQSFFDFSPGQIDTYLTEESRGSLFDGSEFSGLFLKYCVDKPSFQSNGEVNPHKLIRNCYKESLNRVRFSGEFRNQLEFLLWSLFSGSKVCSKKDSIQNEDLQFLQQYSRVVFRKFLLDLKLDNTLRERMLNAA